MGLGGKIENSKEQLQDMSSEKLVTLLESDLHGSSNKQWAMEILTVRIYKSLNKIYNP